jgi:hypothetical protein
VIFLITVPVGHAVTLALLTFALIPGRRLRLAALADRDAGAVRARPVHPVVPAG